MSKPLQVIAFALAVAFGGAAGTSGRLAAAATLQDKPQTSSGTSSADAELQADIQNTLDKEPSLTGTGVRATVTEQQIELTGNVAHSRDKLTAARIALSYAVNKELINSITVNGGPGKAPDAGASPPAGQGSKKLGERSPAANPTPGNVSRPPLP